MEADGSSAASRGRWTFTCTAGQVSTHRRNAHASPAGTGLAVGGRTVPLCPPRPTMRAYSALPPPPSCEPCPAPIGVRRGARSCRGILGQPAASSAVWPPRQSSSWLARITTADVGAVTRPAGPRSAGEGCVGRTAAARQLGPTSATGPETGGIPGLSGRIGPAVGCGPIWPNTAQEAGFDQASVAKGPARTRWRAKRARVA
jgi:hypothetical protein